MLFGHVAVGLAAKPAVPKASLGVLLVASTTVDTLCGVFLVTGVERPGADYTPWSHGLFLSAVLSVAVFAVAYLVSRDRRTSLIVGLLVFSHWILDFISHPMLSTIPDIPLLFEGSPKVGLGLYSNPAIAAPIEFGLFAAGIAYYLSKTKATDRTGTWAFWAMVAFLLALGFSGFIPGIPTVFPIFVINLLLLFGIWIDRHRSLRGRADAHPAPSMSG